MTPPEGITTPASRRPSPQVVVLGAGVAGLTAAHELAERGFQVSVYERRTDERAALGVAPPGSYPPVKLGGLAASQFCSVDDDAGCRLRPFPGRRGSPRPPDTVVAGEHGFRFFPAYYLHLWDLLQRIPVYQSDQDGRTGHPMWRRTSRTVFDNIRRVVVQGLTVDGKPSVVFPREAPRSLAELFTATNQLAEFGFSPNDLALFAKRVARYLVTSPLRREAALTDISAYDYFTGRDSRNGPAAFNYTPEFDALMYNLPKILAAFDARWGDARTNITTFLQLQFQMESRDNKADGVLNGPTTESWFDHWYRHLLELGVQFTQGEVTRLEAPNQDRRRPAHLRPRTTVVMADGTRLTPDYVVVATDAPTAERITAPLRAAGTGGTVAGLDGFATTVAPPRGPLEPEATRPIERRDPYAVAQMGLVPWDRFQTLAGIQFYFDTQFQLARGHMFYTGSDWGLCSINQQNVWENRPILPRDGYVSVVSVCIGDLNTPSDHLLDEHGRGKAARDCTADELAVGVWRQIVAAVTSDVDNVPEALLPVPAWYALDDYLELADGPDGPATGRPVRNGAPYLIPVVGDWSNRPEGEPWNPNNGSWTTCPTEEQWWEDLERNQVWAARHGGYPVHHNSVVFAGTWTRTFTRMTTMESACESARHAVNAVLDHYIWAESGGTDLRENTTLNWRTPFGFLDQGSFGPVRLPSPAGDYCYVFDIENREPLDARQLRNLDSQYFLAGLPHPLDTLGPSSVGGSSMTLPNDYTGQLLGYLQAWRQYFEQATSAGAPQWPVPGWPMPPGPGSAGPGSPGPGSPGPGPAASGPAAPGPGPQPPPFPPAAGLISPWPAAAAEATRFPTAPEEGAAPEPRQPGADTRFADETCGVAGYPPRKPDRSPGTESWPGTESSPGSAPSRSWSGRDVPCRRPGSAFSPVGERVERAEAPAAPRSLYSITDNERAGTGTSNVGTSGSGITEPTQDWSAAADHGSTDEPAGDRPRRRRTVRVPPSNPTSNR
ncbi:MAG TPA: FAD-dependent oxidoreductase [Pseudonocardia sp.]|nr:FAD-dependent oxidoreductase [Pseudonocardia sp.]